MRCILTFLLLLPVFVSGSDDHPHWGDSGISFPKYEDILQIPVNLKAQYPDLVTVIDYGKSIEGRTLRMTVVKRPGRFLALRPAVVIDGTIHGDEYLHIEDQAPQTVLELSNSKGPIKYFLDRGGVFLFVPIINADGFVHRRRTNSNGVDLNRDWDVPSKNFKGFKQVETRSLSNKIAELQAQWNLKFVINIDYHCCAGAALRPYAYGSSMPQQDFENHKKFAQLATEHIGSEYGTFSSVLGYTAMGTTLDFFYDTYKTVSFTYEGKYGTEYQRYEQHVKWWESMLGLIP